MVFQNSSAKMAMQVAAKNVKKAAAKDSSRLVNSPKPSSGKPNTVPPLIRGECVDCVIFCSLCRLEYSFNE